MEEVDEQGKSMRLLSVALPHVTLGDRSIRYMTVSRDYGSFSVNESITSTTNIPLFMAADIIGKTTSTAKNNCRKHHRFGKEGFASKLSFKEIRLNGVTNCGSVWFYSIQGLFKAIFDYHDAEVQHDCLIKLREQWLRTYTDPELPETMFLKLETAPLDSSMGQKRKDFKTPIASDPVLNGVDSSNLSMCAVEECLNHINNLYTKYPLDSDLSVVSNVLDLLKTELEFYRESATNCFPFDLFKVYRSALSDSALHHELVNCDFNIPIRRHFALCAIAEWLGEEFHNLEKSISNRVEIFKRDHINCIDDLPPAETIINALFPCAMKRLLSQWTGLNRLHSTDCLTQDHNYSPPVKQIKQEAEQTRNLYPLIQLILEFANNALVSGTAHVVFSRLRYAV